MFLVLVYPNGKRVDERVWNLDEAKAAMRALVECGLWGSLGSNNDAFRR